MTVLNSSLWSWFLSLFLTVSPAPAPTTVDEKPPLDDMKRFFLTDDTLQRQRLVPQIEGHEDYDSSRLSEALHGLNLYPKIESGRTEIEVDVGFGHRRRITLRLPPGYTPAKAWPLVMAYHPLGGSGPPFIGHAERILGARAKEVIIAAPSRYRQTVADAPPPFTPEHPVMLREIRKTVHVDSDRVYIVGYSLGGEAAWTLAKLHSELYAGSIAVSATCGTPADVEGMWEALFPNMKHVPLLHAWGGRDRLNVPGFNGMRSSGDLASLNRELSKVLVEEGMDQVIDYMVPSAGHGGVQPRQEDVDKIFAHRRPHYPKTVQHRFRHLHQGSAYWLQAQSWVGGHWGAQRIDPKPRRAETRARALARFVMPLLGELKGEIRGQTVEISTEHVSVLDVWFGDGMIDWKEPVTVKVDGKQVFQGLLKRDLGVALSQAARDYDFDRIRWAGLRVEGGKATPITLATQFVATP